MNECLLIDLSKQKQLLIYKCQTLLFLLKMLKKNTKYEEKNVRILLELYLSNELVQGQSCPSPYYQQLTLYLRYRFVNSFA